MPLFLAISAKVTQLRAVLSHMSQLDYIRFDKKVSLRQEIVDTNTGEVLFHLDSSVLLLNFQYFFIILRKFFSLLRQNRNIYVSIRTYSDGSKQLELPKDVSIW